MMKPLIPVSAKLPLARLVRAAVFLMVAQYVCGARPLHAQTSAYYADSATTLTQVNGAPVSTPASHGYISVCTEASPSSNVCTPATIYWDQALTRPVAQPFQADEFGHFGFWAVPGVYRYKICLPMGCRSYTLPTGGAGGGGGTTIGNVTVATANGFTGSATGGVNNKLTLSTDATHMLPVNTGSASTYLNGAGTYTTPAGTGASFPGTSSIVVNTSTSASRNATPTDVSNLLQGADGCTTAGYVYSPQSNTCVPAGSSGINQLTSDVSASGTGAVAATVVGVHATMPSSITALGSAGSSPSLTITSTTPGTAQPLNMLCPNATAGSPCLYGIGTSFADNSMGFMAWQPATNSFLQLQTYNNDNPIQIAGSAINTTASLMVNNGASVNTLGSTCATGISFCVNGGSTMTVDNSGALKANFIAGTGYASQFASSGNSFQGQAALFNGSGCAGGCSVLADPNDPAADVIGQIEPNTSWAFTRATPANGSSLVDQRAGGFAVSHFNANPTTFFAYHYNDAGLISSLNGQHYGAGYNSFYFDMNAGINGQADEGVPSYSPVANQDNITVVGTGTYTLHGENYICAGASDCNFDQRYYYGRDGNDQTSSEGFRAQQWNYFEIGGEQWPVTAYSNDLVTLTTGGNSQYLGVGQPLVDISKGTANVANTGVVNVSGTTVTWVSGVNFASIAAGSVISLENGGYVVTAVASSTSLTLSVAPPAAANVTYTYGAPGGALATLHLATAVTASTATGSLVVPVNPPVGTATSSATIPSYPVDMVFSSTGYNTGDLVNLNGNGGSFIENVTLTGAAAGGTTWSSTATYTPQNVRAQGGNLYQSNTTNTNSSPANGIATPVALSLLQDTGGGTLNIQTASATNFVVGAKVYISGVNVGIAGCNALNGGPYVVQSTSSSTAAVLSGASGGYVNCGYNGTASGDWTLIGTASGKTVATANLRYPHNGGTACANGLVGDMMEVTSQTTNNPNGLGNYRYMQYVTCSPTTTTATVGAIQNGAFVSYGGTNVNSIIFYPAADVVGINQVSSQGLPSILTVSDNAGFPVGDTVEEDAQAYGEYDVDKEAFNFYNPNASMLLHQTFLNGVSGNGVWWQLDNNGGSQVHGTPSLADVFQFNVGVTNFTQFGAQPSTLFDLCYGGGCNGTTAIIANEGTPMLSYSANGNTISTYGAFLTPAINVTAGDDAPTSTFTSPLMKSNVGGNPAPVALFSNTSTYPEPVVVLSGITGGYDAVSAQSFAPLLQLENPSSPDQPWYIGVGGATNLTQTNVPGAYVLAYNSQYTGGAAQTETLAQVCTPGGVCNFPNGLQSGGNAVATSIPAVLYSAAGTPLPGCAAANQGQLLEVKDAASPTYMGAYTSGGTITAAVICSYNGSAYSWLTH